MVFKMDAWPLHDPNGPLPDDCEARFKLDLKIGSYPVIIFPIHANSRNWSVIYVFQCPIMGCTMYSESLTNLMVRSVAKKSPTVAGLISPRKEQNGATLYYM
jgi:hypothetical protein